MHTVSLLAASAEHLQRFFDQIANLAGFICFGTPAAGPPTNAFAWMAAQPIDVLAFPEAHRKHLAHQALQVAQHLAPHTRLAGILDYDTGYSLEPAVSHSRPSGTQRPVRIGLYAWWLEPGMTDLELRLCMTPDCKPGVEEQIAAAFANARTSGTPQPDSRPARFTASAFIPDVSRERYLTSVMRVQDYILSGDCYQANLSQRFQADYSGSLWEAFKELSTRFPSPHCGFVVREDETVLSISPESFLEIDSGIIRTRPIKGTRPRGATSTEDRLMATELRESAKDRAENVMIVDLLRNDLGRVSQTGSVTVEALAELESYTNVHHLVSTVSSRLKPGIHPFAALLECFPGGSITGAPKIRAMEIIAELEAAPRGPYCGSLFWFDGTGKLYSNIAIRTLYGRPFAIGKSTAADKGRLFCHGGGGVVADSDPESEYQETLDKVGPLMTTLTRLGRK